jgi:signal transduction histidine kinase
MPSETLTHPLLGSKMGSLQSVHEQQRLSELYRYSILDTPSESAFDDLAKLTAFICATPISLVSLVDTDRMWFKAKVGLSVDEIPRIDGFCSSAILSEDLRMIPDAQADETLSSHPLVASEPKIRFYAGVPLVTPRGFRIGTLCVADTRPRTLTAEQLTALATLARTVVTQLELRLLLKSQMELQSRTNDVVTDRTAQLSAANESLLGEAWERAQGEKALHELSGKLLTAQDDERRRIARELHDTTGQTLAALSMTLAQMQPNASTANAAHIEECVGLVSAASAEIRSLSYLLHPPLMDVIGLGAAVREFVSEFGKRAGIHITVDIAKGLGRLKGNREIVIFRIVQEGLANVHRHSGSATASVKLYFADQDVILEITDQGRGLAMDSEGKVKYGVGIKSMQERLRPFRGKLELMSYSRETKLTASLPR